MARKLKVAFLEHLNTEVLGIMYISAMLKREGHQTQLFLPSQENNYIDSILAWEPDVIAAQTRTGQHKWALQVCQQLKRARKNLIVIFGGPHATYMPCIVERPCVDIVVRGEGEYVMRDVCNAIANHDDYTAIPGTWIKDEHGEIHENPMGELPGDLDALPYPDRELPYKYDFLRNRGNKAFIGGRGCMYPCTFCHNHLDMRLYKGQGRWARKMSPENFVEEMVYVRDNFPPLRIMNLERDDEFLNTRGWAERVFELIPERVGVPYYMMTRPDSITEDIVRLMKETGCIGVSLSIETANDRLRNEVLKKLIHKEAFLNAMEILNRYKMPTKVFNTVGIPGETIEDGFATLKLNIQVKPTWARCSVMQPYPPTDLYRMCVEQGLFKKDFDLDDFDFFYFKDSPLNFPDIDKLVNLQKFFSITVKFPFLLPITRLLVNIKPNNLFHKLGMIMYGIFGALFERLSFREFVEFSLASASFLLKGKGKKADLVRERVSQSIS